MRQNIETQDLRSSWDGDGVKWPFGMLSIGLSVKVRLRPFGGSSVDTRNWLIRTGISANAVRRRFVSIFLRLKVLVGFSFCSMLFLRLLLWTIQIVKSLLVYCYLIGRNNYRCQVNRN